MSEPIGRVDAMERGTRIQRRRTKGWKLPDGAVCIGRHGPFGNPFPIVKGVATSCGVTRPIWQVGTWEGPALWLRDTEADARELSVKAYRAWIEQPVQTKLRAEAVSLLAGKNVACWCRLDQKCHGDVLLEIAARRLES